jgi:hypothetical protein
MTGFFEAILAFPTVLFTIPVALACLYWLFVVLGAIDLDSFSLDGAEGALEGMDGVLEGGLDGVADGALDGLLDGGLDGVLDGGLDGALDGVADGVLDGALDGVLDGGLDGALDGAADAATEAIGEGAAEAVATGPGALLGLLAGLKLTSVPVTLSMSLIALFGWVLSYLGMAYLPDVLTWSPALLATAVGGAAFLLGTGVTSFAVRPLSPFFARHDARGYRSLIGLTAEVTTGRVDDRFGQAELSDSGDVMLIQVRNDLADNGLKRGDPVLVIKRDVAREAFVVEPLPDFLSDFRSSGRRVTKDDILQRRAEARAPSNPSTRETN